MQGSRPVTWPEIGARMTPYWFLTIAVLAFAVPSLVGLGRIVWTTEQGAHGPIILTTGLWLLWREISVVTPGTDCRRPILIGWLTLALLGYLFGSTTGMLWFEWLSAYVALVAVLYAYVGGKALRALWFPLFYLLFLVPPPYSVIAPMTQALKLWISSTAVAVLSPFGMQVASSGTTLYIDQYELLVAEACSGLNSIVSLLAIGLFYIFLRHRADWRYAAVLAALVLPIAIAANLVRVLILLLITHFFGNAVAQGMLHEVAGMMMFFIALFGLIAVDGLLSPIRNWLGRRR